MEFLGTISELPAGGFFIPETPGCTEYLGPVSSGQYRADTLQWQQEDLPTLPTLGACGVSPSFYLANLCPQWLVRAAAWSMVLRPKADPLPQEILSLPEKHPIPGLLLS